MARWRLMGKHYLNVPSTEADSSLGKWEYKETSKETGKQARKVFNVPTYLNPEDGADCNYPGEIIVSHTYSAQYHKDIIFVGAPTPEMEPIDDEASAISEAEKHKWIHPIESLPGQGYSQSLLDDLTRQLAAAIGGQAAKPAAPVAISGIDPAEFAKVQEQLAALMAKNAELEAAQAEPAKRRA